MKTAIAYVGIAFLILFAAAPGNAQASAAAQADCSTGIVSLPAGINGAIKICPPVAAQAPGAAGELAQILSNLSSQQAELDQLTRLLKDMNQVSGPLGAKRQAELLTNVIARLGSASTVTGAQLQQRASTLSGHFEDVASQINAAEANPTETVKTNAAIQGQMGDAMARLDFDTVTNQLSDIQTTVHAVDDRTKQIQGTVDAIRQDEQAQEQQSQQRMQTMDQQNLANPMTFVMVRLGGNGRPGQSGTIRVGFGHPGMETLTDAKMQLVFSLAGKQASPADVPIPPIVAGNQYLTATIQVPTLGDQVIACFSAFDPRVSQRRRWRQAFMSSQSSPVYLAFNADSEATLTPDSNGPCQ
jgi:hypothetical protein